MSNQEHPSKKHFQDYLEYTRLGLRNKAKEAVELLCASLPYLDEKMAWCEVNLEELLQTKNGQIQHILYGEIILPVLRARIELEEPESFYLLYRTWGNLVWQKDGKDLVEKWTPKRLLEKAIEGDPTCERYPKTLLEMLVGNFSYLDHEWPAGILVDPDSSLSELAEIQKDIKLAVSLDIERRHTERFEEFAGRVDEYVTRVKAYHARVRLIENDNDGT